MSMSTNYIEELVTKLQAWDAAYTMGTPAVSDDVYDAVKREVYLAAPGHPYLNAVGAPVPATSRWPEVRYTTVMGSLHKVHTEPEFRDWATKTGSNTFRASYKGDGFALSLMYEKGVLVCAGTRGEGDRGENIYHNAILFAGVPQRLPHPLTTEIRGEVILTNSQRLKMVEDGLRSEAYANNRNGAVGAGKAGDPTDRSKSKLCSYLTFIAYAVVGGVNGLVDREMEYKVLRSLGFNTFTYITGGIDAIIGFMNDETLRRPLLDFDIDGVVVEVYNFQDCNKLGMGPDNRPRYARAWKFEAETAIGTNNMVTWEVGQGGTITPCANFNPPISLGGTSISRASLHNAKWVKDHAIGDGAIVVIKRAGDVIPQVVSVVTPGPSGVSSPPAFCPECGAVVDYKTTKDGVGAHLWCTNIKCFARVYGKIERWIDTLGVKQFGGALITALVRENLVSSPDDLYKLKADAVAELLKPDSKSRFGDSARTAIQNLKAVKEVDLATFVAGLGITGVDRSTVQLAIDSGFKTYDSLLVATVPKLASIPKMGAHTAQKLVDGLISTAPIGRRLLVAGIKVAPPKTGKFTGLKICFTGSRDLVEIASAEGARIASSCSKDTSFLVAEDLASVSGKAEQARKYGVKIITRDEFLAMLTTAGPPCC